jgi:hypothetical protein
MRLLRTRRDEVIAAAEEHLRQGEHRRLDLLGATYRSVGTQRRQFERFLKRHGFSPELIREGLEHFDEKPQRAEWWVGFIVCGKRFWNRLTSVTVVVDEATGTARILEFDFRGESHNPPMQRSGAAGILSGVRKWFGRGPGR